MAKEPGFYTGSIVFGLALISLLAILITTVIYKPDVRDRVGIFVVVFSLGACAVMFNVFMRIRRAEDMYHGEGVEDRVYSVSACPDTHILNEETGECTMDSAMRLTVDADTQSNYAKDKATKYKLSKLPTIESPQEGRTLKRSNIRAICEEDLEHAEGKAINQIMSLPYASFKPLCGNAPKWEA